MAIKTFLFKETQVFAVNWLQGHWKLQNLPCGALCNIKFACSIAASKRFIAPGSASKDRKKLVESHYPPKWLLRWVGDRRECFWSFAKLVCHPVNPFIVRRVFWKKDAAVVSGLYGVKHCPPPEIIGILSCLGNGSIHLGTNYSVSNEMKWDE